MSINLYRMEIIMVKETVTVRPKFKLSKSDHKTMLRAASIMGFSMSEYIKQALMKRISMYKTDTVYK